MRRCAVVLGLFVMLLGGFAGAATPPLRQSFDLHVPLSPTPVPVEGRMRLFYELHLTNFAATPLAASGVQVIDAASGREIARYSDAALAARLAPIGSATNDDARTDAIPSGSRAVVYIELELMPDAIPASLTHRVDYTGNDGTPFSGSVAGGRVAVDPRPAPLLGPPLRGGPWAAVYDPAWERGHRRVFYTVEGRAVLPGRFAIDLVKLDDAGLRARGDADVVANAHAYGAEVLAVADGTVVMVRNDFPEAGRISENGRFTLADASGNYIVLDIGQQRYAFYEHLTPGSVRVTPGQRVRRGEVLGALGYSGSGNWPHLHFHVGDAPSLLGAEGLPFAIEGFRSLGVYETFDDLGVRPWTPRTHSGTAERRRERPAGNAVVAFPSGKAD
jgi:hypothetical protein